MADDATIAPDSTAVRTALWRALHVERDAPPHVFDDTVGLKLAAPPDGWRTRGDMQEYTRTFRAAIVARARFVEELIAEQAARGVDQYVLLGAGLDTFVQRRPEIASKLTVFEIDRPGAGEWKRRRLVELGYGVPDRLRLVAVDFERGESWWDRVVAEGFDPKRRSVVASLGVSMYLRRETNVETLRRLATLAPGSTVVMTFMPPNDLLAPEDVAGAQMAQKGAAASGTPFISFFRPDEMLALARNAGFREARHVTASDYVARWFAGRTDGLRPSTGEDLLVATT